MSLPSPSRLSLGWSYDTAKKKFERKRRAAKIIAKGYLDMKKRRDMAGREATLRVMERKYGKYNASGDAHARLDIQAALEDDIKTVRATVKGLKGYGAIEGKALKNKQQAVLARMEALKVGRHRKLRPVTLSLHSKRDKAQAARALKFAMRKERVAQSKRSRPPPLLLEFKPTVHRGPAMAQPISQQRQLPTGEVIARIVASKTPPAKPKSPPPAKPKSPPPAKPKSPPPAKPKSPPPAKPKSPPPAKPKSPPPVVLRPPPGPPPSSVPRPPPGPPPSRPPPGVPRPPPGVPRPPPGPHLPRPPPGPPPPRPPPGPPPYPYWYAR